MGMSKSEMEDKFEEIFEFSELERFRNMKLKNFSSGMYARLAFATAAAGVPQTKNALGNIRSEGDGSTDNCYSF
jgi:ABC-type polysaccharide/polyol phosphate transport system ATPase subunit